MAKRKGCNTRRFTTDNIATAERQERRLARFASQKLIREHPDAVKQAVEGLRRHQKSRPSIKPEDGRA